MVGLSTVGAPRAQAQTTEAATASQSATFAIENMTCALCPVTVRKAMEGVSGVKSVSVNFEQKTATVVFDPGMTSTAAIAAASTEAGHPAAAVGQ
ncbi:MAG: heavy metal-associated domain-containing protein [Gammaproteobacteria bacterium]